MVTAFEFYKMLFLLMASCFSVFRVFYCILGKPISARLCRDRYLIIKMLPVEPELVVDGYAAR